MKRIVVVGALILGVVSWPASAQDRQDRTEIHDGAARAALIALSAGSSTLQAYDAYSTLTALRLGASEANPLMRGVAQRPMALVAMKSGVAAASIFAGAQLWRQHHHAAALAVLAATNGAMAIVAAHNASVLGSMRR